MLLDWVGDQGLVVTGACCVGGGLVVMGACCVGGACCDGGTSVGKKGVWET